MTTMMTNVKETLKSAAGVLALAAACAVPRGCAVAFAAERVPDGWRAQFRAGDTVQSGWSIEDIYMAQAMRKAERPRDNVVGMLPEPELSVRLHWRGYRPGFSANAVLLCDRKDGGRMTDRVRFEVEKCAKFYSEFKVSEPVYGRLRGAEYIVTAFLDIDADGAWTPGEPYGVADGVEVGWAGGEAEIELTDVHPSMFRVDMARAMQNNTFDGQMAFIDRRVQMSLSENDEEHGGVAASFRILDGAIGRYMPAATETETRVRVIRLSVNGYSGRFIAGGSDAVYAEGKEGEGVLLDATRDFSGRLGDSVFSERDLYNGGFKELDYGGIESAAVAVDEPYASVTQVTYRVVIGHGTTSMKDATNNNTLATSFANAFEVGGLGGQTKCVPLSPKGDVLTARPKFRWRHDAAWPSRDYPAFRLRVWKGGAAVYDSGVRRSPPRGFDGAYEWTAPICAGMTYTNGVVGGGMQWSVSMLNAKFHEPNTAETMTAFSMARMNNVPGFGALKVVVTNGASFGSARVQAFARPDFKGDFAGEAVLGADNTATIYGLPEGRYYVRAFVDGDGDGRIGGDEPRGVSEVEGGTFRPRRHFVRSLGVSEAEVTLRTP